MTETHKIYVHDKIYVPEAFVDPADASNHYSKRFYDENSCVKCEYKEERHSSSCDSCSAYKGRVVAFNKKRIKGKQYFGFPVGDRKKLEKKIGISFSEFKILDKRVKTPFDYPIKFILKLRDYQEELTSNFLKRGSYGHLVAPPRSGKTASMLYLSCKLGVKTLVIASQHEYLQQYIWHIEGNEAEGIPKCTDLPEIEKRVGKKLYGFPKTEEDYNTMQIMFMTYQSFITAKGKGRLDKLKPNIGFLQIDEAHQGSATEFSSVIGSIPSRYKCAATGTPDRKDKKDWVMRQLVGPVISKISIEMLVPEIRLHPTNISPKKNYTLWVYAMQFLSKNKERNEMIVAQAIKDVKLGHSIVIPVTFKAHVTLLVDAINKAAGKEIAEPYTGGQGGNKELRKDTLTRVKEGKTKVIVGIRRLVQLGLNVPQWSCLFSVIPISNEPNWRQESSRILTPLPNKNPPIIRLFYDDMGQSKGCARNTLNQSLKFKYKLNPSDKQKAKELLSSKKSKPEEENESTFKSSGTLFGSRRI